MENKTLRQKLLDVCVNCPPDFKKAEEIISAGENINASDDKAENAFCSLLNEYLGHCLKCDQDRTCKKCKKNIISYLPQIAKFFISQGLDTERHGVRCIERLALMDNNREVFLTIKEFLKSRLPKEEYKYKNILASLSYQETYLSKLEFFHNEENIIHAMYEAVLAKSKGKAFDGIDTYHAAIGLVPDRLIYFSPTDDIKREERDEVGIGDRGFVYTSDIGLVCGDKVLVIQNPLKILIMNGRQKSPIQTDISHWLNKEDVYTHKVIGDGKIEDISFENKKMEWLNAPTTQQPIIKITFDNNVFMEFTSDWGEHPEREIRTRFKIGRNFDSNSLKGIKITSLMVNLLRHRKISEYTSCLINNIVKIYSIKEEPSSRSFTMLRISELLIYSENEDELLRRLAFEYPKAFE